MANRLNADVRLCDADGNIPETWVDLPRRRNGFIVPRDQVSVRSGEALGLSDREEMYVCYPHDSLWESVPLQARTAWFYCVRQEQSVSWMEKQDMPVHLLGEFIELSNADIQSVAGFAQKWGPLWICHTHGGEGKSCLFVPYSWYESRSVEDCSWLPQEPISAFTTLAARVRSMYVTGKRLLKGEPGLESDWLNIDHLNCKGKGTMPLYRDYVPIPWQRHMLAQELGRWMAMANSPSLMLDWQVDPKRFTDANYPPRLAVLPGLGFFPMICIQLMQSICGAIELATCAECGTLDVVNSERTNTHRGHCCSACTDKARKRRYYHSRRVSCSVCGRKYALTKKWEHDFGNVCSRCRGPRE